jgi:hypothetical protein
MPQKEWDHKYPSQAPRSHSVAMSEKARWLYFLETVASYLEDGATWTTICEAQQDRFSPADNRQWIDQHFSRLRNQDFFLLQDSQGGISPISQQNRKLWDKFLETSSQVRLVAGPKLRWNYLGVLRPDALSELDRKVLYAIAQSSLDGILAKDLANSLGIAPNSLFHTTQRLVQSRLIWETDLNDEDGTKDRKKEGRSVKMKLFRLYRYSGTAKPFQMSVHMPNHAFTRPTPWIMHAFSELELARYLLQQAGNEGILSTELRDALQMDGKAVDALRKHMASEIKVTAELVKQNKCLRIFLNDYAPNSNAGHFEITGTGEKDGETAAKSSGKGKGKSRGNSNSKSDRILGDPGPSLFENLTKEFNTRSQSILAYLKEHPMCHATSMDREDITNDVSMKDQKSVLRQVTWLQQHAGVRSCEIVYRTLLDQTNNRACKFVVAPGVEQCSFLDIYRLIPLRVQEREEKSAQSQASKNPTLVFHPSGMVRPFGVEVPPGIDAQDPSRSEYALMPLVAQCLDIFYRCLQPADSVTTFVPLPVTSAVDLIFPDVTDCWLRARPSRTFLLLQCWELLPLSMVQALAGCDLQVLSSSMQSEDPRAITRAKGSLFSRRFCFILSVCERLGLLRCHPSSATLPRGHWMTLYEIPAQTEWQGQLISLHRPGDGQQFIWKVVQDCYLQQLLLAPLTRQGGKEKEQENDRYHSEGNSAGEAEAAVDLTPCIVMARSQFLADLPELYDLSHWWEETHPKYAASAHLLPITPPEAIDENARSTSLPAASLLARAVALQSSTSAGLSDWPLAALVARLGRLTQLQIGVTRSVAPRRKPSSDTSGEQPRKKRRKLTSGEGAATKAGKAVRKQAGKKGRTPDEDGEDDGEVEMLDAKKSRLSNRPKKTSRQSAKMETSSNDSNSDRDNDKSDNSDSDAASALSQTTSSVSESRGELLAVRGTRILPSTPRRAPSEGGVDRAAALEAERIIPMEGLLGGVHKPTTPFDLPLEHYLPLTPLSATPPTNCTNWPETAAFWHVSFIYGVHRICHEMQKPLVPFSSREVQKALRCSGPDLQRLLKSLRRSSFHATHAVIERQLLQLYLLLLEEKKETTDGSITPAALFAYCVADPQRIQAQVGNGNTSFMRGYSRQRLQTGLHAYWEHDMHVQWRDWILQAMWNQALLQGGESTPKDTPLTGRQTVSTPFLPLAPGQSPAALLRCLGILKCTDRISLNTHSNSTTTTSSSASTTTGNSASSSSNLQAVVAAGKGEAWNQWLREHWMLSPAAYKDMMQDEQTVPPTLLSAVETCYRSSAPLHWGSTALLNDSTTPPMGALSLTLAATLSAFLLQGGEEHAHAHASMVSSLPLQVAALEQDAIADAMKDALAKDFLPLCRVHVPSSLQGIYALPMPPAVPVPVPVPVSAPTSHTITPKNNPKKKVPVKRRKTETEREDYNSDSNAHLIPYWSRSVRHTVGDESCVMSAWLQNQLQPPSSEAESSSSMADKLSMSLDALLAGRGGSKGIIPAEVWHTLHEGLQQRGQAEAQGDGDGAYSFSLQGSALAAEWEQSLLSGELLKEVGCTAMDCVDAFVLVGELRLWGEGIFRLMPAHGRAAVPRFLCYPSQGICLPLLWQLRTRLLSLLMVHPGMTPTAVMESLQAVCDGATTRMLLQDLMLLGVIAGFSDDCQPVMSLQASSYLRPVTGALLKAASLLGDMTSV